MRKPIAFGLLALALVACRAVASDDVKTVVEKAIKAHGGEEKLAKYKAIRLKGKGTLDISGNDIEFIADIKNLLPNKFHAQIRLDAGGQQVTITQIYDGKKGWIGTDMQTKEADDAELKSMREEAHASYLENILPLRDDKTLTVKSIARQNVDGKPTLGLIVTAKNRGDLKMYFDKESGLLVKLQRTIETPDKAEVDSETFYRDYQEFSGVKQAMKQLIHRDGKKYLEFEATEVKMLEKLDESTFEQP